MCGRVRQAWYADDYMATLNWSRKRLSSYPHPGRNQRFSGGRLPAPWGIAGISCRMRASR